MSFIHASVETKLPSAEMVRGLAVGFRQMYAPEEPASFSRAMSILQQVARNPATDATDAQVGQLATWGAAPGKLRSKWLTALVYERAES